MNGYLLDANHVSAHFNSVPSFMAKVRLVPTDVQWRVCSITLGEIEASHQMSLSTNQLRRDDYAAFVIEQYAYNALEITASTRTYYASIIGRIWKKRPPANSRTKTEKHLVACGVDINDVWMVSAAWEHGLILLTSDAMTCVREVVPEVQVQCWI